MLSTDAAREWRELRRLKISHCAMLRAEAARRRPS
jgi:hypothetical protein